MFSGMKRMDSSFLTSRTGLTEVLHSLIWFWRSKCIGEIRYLHTDILFFQTSSPASIISNYKIGNN